MSKRILKLISVILVIVFLTGAPVYAFAAEARASAWFSGYGASIATFSSGKMNVEFTVVGTGTMTKLGASVIDIYRADGTFMKTISYTTEGNEYMMGYNTAYHSGSVTFYGISNQKYYAVVTFFARNSSGADTRTYVTSIVTAK